MGFYSPSSLVRDAQNHGVRVEDVCALRSEYDCTLERLTVEPGRTPCEEMKSAPAALRLGLRLVRGLGHSASQRIVAARELGSMTELSELVTRADLKRDAVEALAEAGALEAVLPGRRQALWKAHAPRLRGLFEGLELAEPKAMLPRLQKHEKLVLDYETKGLSIDDHPLKYLRERLKRRGVLEAAALTSVRHGLWVRVAGLVVCRQQPMTASGIVFITLEDETGDCNLVLQRQVLSQFSHEARHAPLLLASGWLERHQDPEAEVAVVHLLVRRLERLRPTGAKVRSVTRNFR